MATTVKFRKQRGIAMAYILGSIALMSIVAASASQMNRGVARAQLNFDNKQALLNQFQLIRSRILYCGVAYPAGDVNGDRFPRTPEPPSAPVPIPVSNLTCPGKTDGANNLWSGTGGLTLPSPPPAFNAWNYTYDNTNGMRLTIQAKSSTDTDAIGVLQGIAQRLDGVLPTPDKLVVPIMAPG